jgi:hypothetical protein
MIDFAGFSSSPAEGLMVNIVETWNVVPAYAGLVQFATEEIVIAEVSYGLALGGMLK